MNISYDIYYLKGEIQKIEYELIEERFHYHSIPKRLEKTKSELRYRNASILLVTLLFIGAASLYFNGSVIGKQSFGNDISTAIFAIVMPIAMIAFGTLDAVLIIGWIQELGLIHGKKKKSLNFGASNYHEEKKLSEEKIRTLTKKIHLLEAQIKELQESKSYEVRKQERDLEAKQNRSVYELNREEFFAYAYGRWGDDKEDLLFKKSVGTYDEEKKQLLSQIQREKDFIDELAKRRIAVNEQYDVFIAKILSYILLILGLILSIVLVKEFPTFRLILGILGGLICLILGFVIYFQNKETLIYYFLDNHYDLISYYAEDHNLKPTLILKQKALRNIEEYEKRLDYVELILHLDQYYPN